MKVFDRISLRQIKADLLLEMQAVGDKHGFTVAIVGGSFGPQTATLKVSLVAGVGEDAQEVERKEWELSAKLFGMEADDYGRTFRHKGRSYVVKRINRRARTTPIVCDVEGEAGRSFRFPSKLARMLIDRYRSAK